jgi:hypothetical protein
MEIVLHRTQEKHAIPSPNAPGTPAAYTKSISRCWHRPDICFYGRRLAAVSDSQDKQQRRSPLMVIAAGIRAGRPGQSKNVMVGIRAGMKCCDGGLACFVLLSGYQREALKPMGRRSGVGQAQVGGRERTIGRCAEARCVPAGSRGRLAWLQAVTRRCSENYPTLPAPPLYFAPSITKFTR